jgi:tetratricopeptide (TPR) repeat protein
VKDGGDMQEAIRLYALAIDLCPPEEKKEKAIFHNNLGISYIKIDQQMSAKGQFSLAIENNPEYPKPLWQRLHIYKAEQEYEKALEDAKKIIEVDPSF